MSELRMYYAMREELYDLAMFLDACWKSAYADILDSHILDTLSSTDRHIRLLEAFDNKTREFLILRDWTGIVGAAGFGISLDEAYAGAGEIAALYVRSDRIGQGYGHTLMVGAEEKLRTEGFSYCVLGVFKENASAIRFYQSHGYKKEADKSFAIDGVPYPPYIIMRKDYETGEIL